MADVVYFARDMVFTSKIREVARQVGVGVAPARDPASLAAAAAGARLVLVDLRLPEAMAALAALRADPASAGVATVGFIDHERVDVMEAARAQGCGEVLTKGQFAHALPKLLARVAPAGQAAVSPPARTDAADHLDPVDPMDSVANASGKTSAKS
jgi:hypothetical protein